MTIAITSGGTEVTERVDQRQRLVFGTLDMLRRRGFTAMSVRDLAKHSKAPLGSTYHYFPGGKEQLATEAIQMADHLVLATLDDGLQHTPAAGVNRFIEWWKDIIVKSNFHAGCPVLAIAVEDGQTLPDTMRHAAAQAFTSWQQHLTDSPVAHGVDAQKAARTALLVVCACEGAVAMCRLTRSTDPLDTVHRQLIDQIETLCPHG